MKKSGTKKHNSILFKLLVPMLLFLLMQTGAIWAIFFGTGIVKEVQNSAFNAFNERVETRKTYLQNEMALRWGNLENVRTEIVTSAHRLYERNGLTEEQLKENPLINVSAIQKVKFSDLLFTNTYESLKSVISNNAVTGAFVAFLPRDCSTNLAEALYLRCETPLSVDRQSLVVTIGSNHMMNYLTENNIATGDRFFSSQLILNNADYIFKPYDAYFADEKEGIIGATADYGYWATPHTMVQHGASVITYSVPLVSNGVVYGVLGIDLSVSYVEKSMPYHEISGGQNGSYLIAESAGDGNYNKLIHTGTDYAYLFGTDKSLTLTKTSYGGDKNYETNGLLAKDKAYFFSDELKLYDKDSYFRGQNWRFLGLITDDAMLGFSRKITYTIIFSFLGGDAIGIIILVLVARHITAPVIGLPKKITALSSSPLAKIERTNISEIDALISSIEDLRGAVMENSDKMSKIIELSGVPLGAFEVDVKGGLATFAGKMAEITDRSEFKSASSAAEFTEYLAQLEHSRVEEDGNSRLYNFTDSFGAPRWISMRSIENERGKFGIVQDVTGERLDRHRLEYERDYDVLTGILNRRAYLTRIQKIEADPESIKNAALILLDMDNLKVINDTFGHELGDEYLRSMAKTLKAFIVSGNELLSRLSGDEFVIFLYGYNNPDELRREISELKKFIDNAYVILPTNQKLKLRCSGGAAFYPQDASNLDELLLYADFTMYEVKQNTRGEFGEFNREHYSKREYRSKSYENLNTLIEKNLVDYEYQPIVSLKTGEIYGYEALMRPRETSLTTPQEVLSMARAQHKLYQIERLTWFNALEGFSKFTGKAAERVVFINSISSEAMNSEDLAEIERLYKPLLSRTVLEFTEEEKLSEEKTKLKKEVMARWGGSIALDDFGTGYSNDTVLLILNPNFIKVDMLIIRDINMSPNKRKLLKNIVSYAQEHKIKVIAEGVETRAELESVIACGADYVQGFYVARPAAESSEISNEKRKEIREVYAAFSVKEPRKKMQGENTRS